LETVFQESIIKTEKLKKSEIISKNNGNTYAKGA
jgi:hypothetical protein